jgi:hypothetical protein
LLKKRLAARLRRSYFIRFHMSLIFLATILSGMLFSKALLLLGVKSMSIRYGIAVTASYLGFFMFVKLWLLYVAAGTNSPGAGGSRADRSPLDVGSLPDVTGAGDGIQATLPGSGGASGGGGAGGSFVEDGGAGGSFVETGASAGIPPADSGGGSGVLDGVGAVGDVLDVGDDALALVAILLLILLALSVVLGGVYLVWCAPTILTETAFHVLMVGSFAGKVRRVEEGGWEVHVLKATWWIFVLVLLASIAFGIVAHMFDPAAVTAREVVRKALEVWWGQ